MFTIQRKIPYWMIFLLPMATRLPMCQVITSPLDQPPRYQPKIPGSTTSGRAMNFAIEPFYRRRCNRYQECLPKTAKSTIVCREGVDEEGEQCSTFYLHPDRIKKNPLYNRMHSNTDHQNNTMNLIDRKKYY